MMPGQEADLEIVKDRACPNRRCQFFGVKGGENVFIRRRYGPDQIRFLNCRGCQAQFSERRGTPLFDLRLPKAKIVDVVKHLAEGTGVRATHRLTGASRYAVGHILKLVGKHAMAIHEELVRDLEVPEAQMDEMWSFVKKKTRISRQKRKPKARRAANGTTRP